MPLYHTTAAEASSQATGTVFIHMDTEIQDIYRLTIYITHLTIQAAEAEAEAEAVADARVHVLALVQAADVRDAVRRILPKLKRMKNKKIGKKNLADFVF